MNTMPIFLTFGAWQSKSNSTYFGPYSSLLFLNDSSKRPSSYAYVFLPLFRYGLAELVIAETPGWLLDHYPVVVYSATLSHLDAFAIGAFFALFVQREIHVRTTGTLITGVLFLGFVTEYVHEGSISILNLGYGPFLDHSYKYVWAYSLLNLCFAVVLYKMKSRQFLPHIFEHPTIVYLGKISYGLYVYHLGVLETVRYGLPYLPGPFHQNPELLQPFIPWISLALSILVSAISFHIWEERFIKLKDIWAPKKLA